MAMMFGGSPVQTPSIDAVLAGMGLGGSTPAGSPDPSAVLAGLGIRPAAANLTAAPPTQGAQPAGLDLSSLMGQPAPQQPAPDPSQPSPANVAANASAALPANLALGNRNPIGDLLDNIFLGGAIQHVRGAERDRALQDVQTQRNLQQYSALQQQIAALPDGDDKRAAMADPLGYAKTLMARIQPFDSKAGETHGFGNNTFYTAPVTGIANGRGYSVDGRGVASTGGAVIPGKQIVDPGSGAVVDENTGPTGTYLPQFHSAPVTDNAGYTAPNGANLAPGLGGGTAPTGGAQGGTPNAAPPDAYSAAVVKLESGGNPNARNGSSIGILQFHPSTFKQFNPTGDINNPADQQVALQNETAHNTQVLQGAGLQATPQNLYLLHQQGTSGGLALLQNPDKNAVQTLVDGGFYPNPRVARRAITRNYGTADMTGGQFAGVWGGKLSRALRQTGGAAAVTAGPAQPASQGGGQFPSGWQGKGYSYDPKTGIVTSPQGQPSAGPGFYGPSEKNQLYDRVAKSDDYQQAQNASIAYKALIGNAKTMTGPSAYAILDTFARAINPGAVARPQVIETIEKNLGPLNHVQGSWAGLQGQGNLTPQVRQQVIDAVLPFVRSHWQAANALNQNNVQTAQRHGFDPRDVTAPLEDAPRRFMVGSGKFVPNPGDVEGGYRFNGGNPSDHRNWTKVN